MEFYNRLEAGKIKMRKIFLFIISTFIFFHVFAQDELPLIGTIKTIQKQVCRIDGDLNRKVKVDYTYTTDPGWQILSCEPIILAKNQTASYSLTYTPTKFIYISTSAIYSKFIQLLELAAEKNVFQKYEGQIHKMRSDFEKYSTKKVSSYTKITITGLVAANNSLRLKKPGKLYLDLKILLIYIPETEEPVLQSLEYLRQIIDFAG